MNKQLITQIVLNEDIAQNGEGLDSKILCEALNVADTDFSAPTDGADFLLQLAKDGLL